MAARLDLVRHFGRLSGRERQVISLRLQSLKLREIGCDDVDFSEKWLEMALLVGVKPDAPHGNERSQ